MRADLDIFGSRIALRVFASFVIAACLPVVVTVVLVATQVVATLTDAAEANLDHASRTVGNTIMDRLILAADFLDATSGEVRLRPDAAFAMIESVPLDGTSLILPEPFLSSAFDNRLRNLRKPTLFTQITDTGPEIVIARGTNSGLTIGRVNPDYLWNASALLGYGMDLCVVDGSLSASIYCSRPAGTIAAESVLAALRESARSIEWRSDETDVMASVWQLFLESRFQGSDPWAIVVSQPQAIALSPLADFNRLFPQVVAACLIIVLLLSALQIRRIMSPLRQLVAGTRRVANRDFTTHFPARGSNEFAELSKSLNDMTARLGNQFETITAFAEIDRLILSSQSIDQVMEKVLDRMVDLIPDYCVSVLLLDPDQDDRGQLYSRLPETRIQTIVARCSLSKRTRSWLASNAAGGSIEPDWLRKQIDSLPQQADATTAVVVPIFRGEILRGALIAQMLDRDALSDREKHRLLELTSRLGVAISAADHESELFQRAHFDALTGLPNRQLLFDRLYQAVAQARREQHQLALLFIDLDKFKNINDSLGHPVGDELLKEMAIRLAASVRETDTVARLGGDEYVVVLPHVQGVLEVETIAEKILQVINRPYRIRDQEFTVSASIGATLFPNDASDADELLRKADTAMYSAKDAGRARVTFFEDEMDRIVHERLEMQQDLKEAFKRGQLRLVYQPQLDIESGKLVCMEALIRWHSPSRGMVPPSTFVPILEEMGLVNAVGEWAIETALADYARWNSQGLELPRIAVNVSSHQLIGGDLRATICNALAKFGLTGANIEIELTEHSLIQNYEAANQVLNQLRDQGIRVAIDDFGTGYSSLGYLQDLEFDVLKIDRGFIKYLPSDKSVAIVEAIVGVANALGKEVVAEGIDAETQRSKLVQLGCMIGQGYLFSVPIEADDVIEWSHHLDVTSVIEKLVARDHERIAS